VKGWAACFDGPVTFRKEKEESGFLGARIGRWDGI
jgi:hypothetical protein